MLEPPITLQPRNNVDSKRHENGNLPYGARTNSRGHYSNDIVKHMIPNQWGHFERPDSFDASDEYHSQELSLALYQKEEMAAKRNNLVRTTQIRTHALLSNMNHQQLLH